MDSGTINHEEKRGQGLHAMIRFSKYTVMVALIVLPFVGGWVGYQYALGERVEKKEDLVEVPNAVEVEKNDFKDTSTRITIETPFKDQEYHGQYPSIKRFTFDNTKYVLTFMFPRGVDASDNNVSNPAYSASNNSITIDFKNLSYDDGEPVSVQLDVHNAGYCRKELCEKEALSVHTIGNYEWEYVGAYAYGDAGQMFRAPHVYRHYVGDYAIYLQSDIPLHEDAQSVYGLAMILDSLSLLPR